jgi:hypothetical protein
MDVDAHRVRTFRLAGQGLAAFAGDAHDALAGWAIQDSPPGSATAALAARVDALEPGWLDDALYEERTAVALYNPRTATAIVPAADAAAYATAMLPHDDAGMRAVLGQAVPDRNEGFAEPVQLAVDAVADALDGTVLSRDDLHEALRQRLPPELLPWCPGCQSHHARRGLLVMAGLHGKLCIAGRAGRQPAFARTDQWVDWTPPTRTDAATDLVRRYLTSYGPSTPSHLAEWAGLAPAHARDLWSHVADEFAEVQIEGRTRAWLLAADLPRLEDPPAARGVRLLATGDPLVLGRDRASLVPDEAVRKQVWSATGGAGLLLADGEAAATWRARKQGRRLAVAVKPFGRVPRAAVKAEAERLAPHRGCKDASVDWT